MKKEIEVSDLSENQKERLLSKVSRNGGGERRRRKFLAMKYQVTQVFWESVMGEGKNRVILEAQVDPLKGELV